jgi:thiamine-phosphate pyrophosphorylase
MTSRFCLVAPDTIDESLLLHCATAACAAADCATIIVPETVSQKTITALQALNLAVILKDCEARKVHHLKADGLLLGDSTALKEARAALKNESLGFLAGVSRHAAMEAAEAGVDFVCFTQTKQVSGEPIISWWQDVTDVPAVAFDPIVDAILKPQCPDFIRPPDAMWQSADAATSAIHALQAAWSK